MKKCIIYILLIMLFLTGCTKVETSIESDIIPQSQDDNEIIIDSIDELNEIKDVRINDKDIIDDSTEKPEGKEKSPLTGLYIDKNLLINRPIAVMIDNYYKARPQAGLSEADIIYEILAEGNITRYLAIFHSEKPEVIGPVRSARPYFIAKALEYNPLYVHVGGSPQAFIDLSELKVADIDALSSGRNVFWRKNHKPIPNNMYTSIEAIKKEGERKGYTLNSNFTPLEFNESDENIKGDTLENIKFPYRNNYISEFRYDDDEKSYYRYVNNEPHKDETTDIHLSAKNIIVQYADNKVLDSEGRLEIDLIGEGKGYYVTNGTYMDIKWKKESRSAQTIIYDLQGNQIILNPGKTWYQVVPKSMNIKKQ